MALDSAMTLVIGAGNFFTAPYVVGSPQALPADLSVVPAAPWENIGHTSLEDIFNITSEGGEATTLGTLQNKSLRTTYSPRTETFAITLQQWDTEALTFYFGSNATIGANGELQVPDSPAPTIVSFLAIFTDGDKQFAFYAPKAEVLRGDDMSLSDTESLAGLPISVKPVVHGSNTWAYAVTPLDAVVTP